METPNITIDEKIIVNHSLHADFPLSFSADSENPFEKTGYAVLMATSSKGEFAEFHDQEDIVEIGSVLYNTKTKEIVEILDKDSTSIDVSAAIVAMSIDPLCERYYWISPYAYVANNPLKFIDPDGRKIVIVVGGQQYTYSPQGGVVNQTTGKQLYATEGSMVKAVVGAYNTLHASGDAVLKGQIDDLVNSSNNHYIDVPGDGSNSVSSGDKSTTRSEDKANRKSGKSMGSTTNYNFSKAAKEKFKASTGLESTNETTVGHELRHQHDNEKGNMKDSNGKGAKDPVEQRAVKNENRVRKIQGLPARTTYGGEEIDPGKLK